MKYVFAKLQMKMERKFYERRFKLSKKICPIDVSINLQLSTDDFQVTTKGGKQQHYKKLKQIRYFNIINIVECWYEIGCTADGSVIN